MPKRSTNEKNDPKPNFEGVKSDVILRKKIKLDHEKIISKIKETNEEIDINEHEVHKFLLVFNTLIKTFNSVESKEDKTDGIVSDSILQMVNLITGLLKSNIDNLTVPTVLKVALKSLFIPQKEDIEERKPEKVGEPEPENGENSNRTSSTERNPNREG